MNMIKTVLVAFFLLASTQAHAWTLDLSSNGLGGIALQGIQDITFEQYQPALDSGAKSLQEVSGPGNTLAVGDKFLIYDIDLQANGTVLSNNSYKSYLNSNILAITGFATGHITEINGDLASFVYDSVNLELSLNGTALAYSTDIISQGPNTIPVDLQTSAAQPSYGIVSLLDATMSGLFLTNSGQDMDSIPGSYTTARGSLFFNTSTIDDTLTPTDVLALIQEYGWVPTQGKSVVGLELIGMNTHLTAATPEPASMLLLGSGLLGLYGVRRRRKAN